MVSAETFIGLKSERAARKKKSVLSEKNVGWYNRFY